MGLNIRVHNITCPNSFTLSYRISATPGNESVISTGYTQYGGTYVSSNTRDYNADPIVISGSTFDNIFDQTVWIKIKDSVTDGYIIENIKIHELEYYDYCIHCCDFSGGTGSYLAGPTPTPTSSPTATPTPTPSSTPAPTATPGPTATTAPTATPGPTATPEPTSTPTPTPSSTAVTNYEFLVCYNPYETAFNSVIYTYTQLINAGFTGVPSFGDTITVSGSPNVEAVYEYNGTTSNSAVAPVITSINEWDCYGNPINPPTATPTSTATPTPTPTTESGPNGCITMSQSDSFEQITCLGQGPYTNTITRVTATLAAISSSDVTVMVNGTRNWCYGGPTSPEVFYITITAGNLSNYVDITTLGYVDCGQESYCQAETITIDSYVSLTPNYDICASPTPTPTDTPSPTATDPAITWCYFDIAQQVEVGPFNSLQECQNISNNPDGYVCNQCIS